MSIGNVTGLGSVMSEGLHEPSTLTAAAQPSTLPEPIERMMLSDDSIHEIAAMLARSALNDRKEARRMRTAAEKTIAQQTHARIGEMREKADAVRTGAWVSGVAGMSAGACSVAGGYAQLRSASQLNTGRALTKSQEVANQKLAQQSTAYGHIGSGMGQIVQGGGTAVGGIFQGQAEECEANAAAHEAIAGRAERAVDEHTAEMASASELFGKVMQFLQEVRSSQNGAAQAAIVRG